MWFGKATKYSLSLCRSPPNISFLLSSHSWTTFLFQERIILHSFKSIICRLCFASLCFKFSDQISVTQFLSFHSETARLDYHSTDHYSSFILLLIKKSKIKKIISFSHGQHFYNQQFSIEIQNLDKLSTHCSRPSINSLMLHGQLFSSSGSGMSLSCA